MKRKLLIATFLSAALLSTNLLAQDKRTSVYGVEMRTNALEVGVEYLSPMGDFKSLFRESGYGAAARYRIGITENKSMLFSLGYQHFKGGRARGYQLNTAYDVDLDLIPVKFGLQFNLLKGLYVSGETGFSISTGIPDYEMYGGNDINKYKISTILFNFSPAIGFQLPLKKKNYIDLSARYEGIADRGLKAFVGFRAAYAFNIAR